jgi:hypothetical protein
VTIIFAADVLSLLMALLTVGSLSDYIGRLEALTAHGTGEQERVSAGRLASIGSKYLSGDERCFFGSKKDGGTRDLGWVADAPTPHVREERPVGADAGAILIRLGDVVGANRDQPAIANLQLTMECNKPFSLPAVLGAETSAAEDEDQWMLSLQFGELSAFRGVVGKLVVGEDSPWNNVGSHMKSLTAGCASPGCVSMVMSS